MKKLLEYSVIYTNRSSNLMSQLYKKSFKNLNSNLCNIYNAEKSTIIPGSGSTAMEAVARQFGVNKKCMIIQNGYFSYRWHQLFNHGTPHNITNNVLLNKAKININKDKLITVSPPSLSKMCDNILKEKPDLICFPHVETSTGIMLDDEYIKEIGNTARKVGSIVCLDGIASGTMWIDMKKLNVDLYITAPQKGWSSPASCGVIMFGDRIQVTGFVPFMLNKPKYTHTFRIGLFGLDKLKDPRKTIEDFGKIL